MQTRQYRVVLEPNELGGFTVIVPALPGCVTEGKDRQQALARAREAIEAYLESLRADGEEAPADVAWEEARVEVAA
jgi:predicted RNase H-like HicB family nuclease